MNKRKVPDSNYIPPVHYNRSISHQHTNSLPVATHPIHPQLSQINHNLSGSTNDLPYDQFTTTPVQFNPQYTTPASTLYNNIKQEPVSCHKVLNKLHQNTLNHSVGHHVKTFSLPVDMAPMNAVNEAPLPAGWSSAKTSTGQIYFIKYFKALKPILIGS